MAKKCAPGLSPGAYLSDRARQFQRYVMLASALSISKARSALKPPKVLVVAVLDTSKDVCGVFEPVQPVALAAERVLEPCADPPSATVDRCIGRGGEDGDCQGERADLIELSDGAASEDIREEPSEVVAD